MEACSVCGRVFRGKYARANYSRHKCPMAREIVSRHYGAAKTLTRSRANYSPVSNIMYEGWVNYPVRRRKRK